MGIPPVHRIQKEMLYKKHKKDDRMKKKMDKGDFCFKEELIKISKESIQLNNEYQNKKIITTLKN